MILDKGTDGTDGEKELLIALKKHTEVLSISTLRGMNVVDGYGKEFEEIEITSQSSEFEERSSARRPENRKKNRHSNVLPYDRTRVVLRDGGPDYINANYIHNNSNEVIYIAAQAPLEITLLDFWRMIWQEQTIIIVMLTKIVEDKREKCHRYYPKSKSPIKDIPPFKIKLLDKETKHKGALVKRRLEITHLDLNVSREVIHFQHKEWPDHEPPANTNVFNELLQDVDTIHEKDKQKPITVHCSAGIGRTGTFCTVHSVLHKSHKIISNPALIVKNTLLELRNDRANLVQTKEQYQYIYRSILEQLESNINKPKL